MPSIEVKDLQFAYGKHQVLQGLSFSAERGQCIGIVGKNGCGKSTLLGILAGMRKPKAGQILYEGQDACRDKTLFREDRRNGSASAVPWQGIPGFSFWTNRVPLWIWLPKRKSRHTSLPTRGRAAPSSSPPMRNRN